MFYRIWKIMQSEISLFWEFLTAECCDWPASAVFQRAMQLCLLLLLISFKLYIKFRKFMKISHEYNIKMFSLHNPEMNPPHVLVSGLSSGFFQWRTVHRIHQRSQQLGERIHLLLGQTQRPIQLEEVIVSLSKLNQKLSQSSLYTLAHY